MSAVRKIALLITCVAASACGHRQPPQETKPPVALGKLPEFARLPNAATPTPIVVAQAETTPAATPKPTPTKAPGEIDTASLPKEALKPIDIEADIFEVNAKEKKGVFRGSVVARQGDVTIRANRVEALYSKQANAIVKAVAEGGVTVTSGAKVGKADRAEFNNDQRTVVLSGEPRLWEEGSLLEGREIIFHVDDGRVECFECSLDLDPTRLQEMQDDIRRTPAPGP